MTYYVAGSMINGKTPGTETVTETDRRRFQRIFLDRPALLVAEGKSYPGSLLDISLAGALMTVESGRPAPAVGSAGIVDIALGDNPEFLIRMEVAVCRADGVNVGLRTTRIDLDDACRLRRLVELNFDDPELLQREFEELRAPAEV